MSNDNAGNGLRGLRAVPSPELHENIREQWGLAGIETDLTWALRLLDEIDQWESAFL